MARHFGEQLIEPAAHYASAQPVQPGERLSVIDGLRGFAIFGILLVNLMFFASPIYSVAISSEVWTNPLDRAADWFIAFFAEGKFFTLFSFLFGLGLAFQMERAEVKGVRVVPLYVRRLGVLLLFGLAHVILFWWGDILTYYALLGFPLLLFRNRRPRQLLGWALGLLIVPLLLNAALFGLLEFAKTTPEGAAQINAAFAESEREYEGAYAQALETYRMGSFGEMVSQRLEDYSFSTLGVTLNGMLFVVFAMFLLGLYAGKRRLFQDVPRHLPLLRRVFVACTLLGLGGTVLYTTWGGSASALSPSLFTLLGLVGYLVGSPALSLAYASGLTLLAQHRGGQRLLNPLVAVGRTALSNYFFQTLVCTTLFYSYGFGLYGQVGPAFGIVLTLVIFAAQVYLSNLWVRHFRFGPLEWLWRSLTYGKRQPLRLRRA